MPLPAFSVIIPTFNRRRTIERALSSVFDQRHPAEEIIVVDDASDDDTVAFVGRRFPEVHLLRHGRNRGPAVARNAAIGRASGTHLAFLDSDDAWHEDYLEVVAETWRAHPEVGIVYTQYDKIEDRPGGRIDPMNVQVEGDQIEAMLRNNFIHSCSLMSTRRDWTVAIGGFDPSYKIGEDRAMYLRLLKRGPAIAVPRRLVRRHVGDDNLINDLERWWQDATAIVSQFVSHPDFAAYRWVEDQSRARVWDAIRWHDRQRRAREARSSRQSQNLKRAPIEHGPDRLPRSHRSTVILFLHGGGLPMDQLSALLEETGIFGCPATCFDHDGPLFEKALDLDSNSLDDYVNALSQGARREGQPLSAIVSYRDLKWLAPTSAFRRLMGEGDSRVLRLRSRDLALQALRLADAGAVGSARSTPCYAAISAAVIRLQNDEAFGERWLSDCDLKAADIWLEDLHEPGLPNLGDLMPKEARHRCKPLPPPEDDDLAAARRFREEAKRRHWSHALVAPPSASSPMSA